MEILEKLIISTELRINGYKRQIEFIESNQLFGYEREKELRKIEIKLNERQCVLKELKFIEDQGENPVFDYELPF